MLQLSTSIFSFSSSAFIADHNVICYEISLWWVVISCPRSLPSQLLMHPQPAHWQGNVRNREILDAVQWLLSSSYNINVLSTLFWSKIQNIAPYGFPWRKLTPSQPDSVHLLALIIIRTVNCSVYRDKARHITIFAQIEKEWRLTGLIKLLFCFNRCAYDVAQLV